MAAAGGADPAGVVGLQQQGSFTEQEGLSDGVSGMMHGSGAESDEREMFERQMSSAVAAAEDFLWFDIEAHAIPSPGKWEVLGTDMHQSAVTGTAIQGTKSCAALQTAM
jgi:hypothetical protein